MSTPTLTTNGSEPLTESPDSPGSPDPFELFTIGQMTTRVADIAVEKGAHPWSFLVRSLVGGAMVSFGVLLSLVVSTGVPTPGIASLLMGLAFGMSFALILVSGMSLITADMAAGAMAILQRRMTVLGYLRLLAIGLIGNCVGALAFVAVCAAAGGPYLGAFAQRAAAVAAAKTSQPALTAVLLAVVCTASDVWELAAKTRQFVDRFADGLFVLAILAFVLVCNIGLPVDELDHHRLELPLAHLPVPHEDARLGT